MINLHGRLLSDLAGIELSIPWSPVWNIRLSHRSQLKVRVLIGFMCIIILLFQAVVLCLSYITWETALLLHSMPQFVGWLVWAGAEILVKVWLDLCPITIFYFRCLGLLGRGLRFLWQGWLDMCLLILTSTSDGLVCGEGRGGEGRWWGEILVNSLSGFVYIPVLLASVCDLRRACGGWNSGERPDLNVCPNPTLDALVCGVGRGGG